MRGLPVDHVKFIDVSFPNFILIPLSFLYLLCSVSSVFILYFVCLFIVIFYLLAI